MTSQDPTRQDLRNRGHAIRQSLNIAPPSEPELLPGFEDFFAEAAYGGIWDRPHLGHQERMLCTLGVLSVHQREQLGDMIGSALDLCLAPRAILEVFMQVGLYGGFITTESSVKTARAVFKARGIEVAPEPSRDDDNDTLDARGHKIMAMLHGERAGQGYAAPGNEITGALYPSAIRYGYGELWDRPGLSHRKRMLTAISAFTALSLEALLRKFSQSALNIGLTKEEVMEAVIQTGPYSGFPRALIGLGILSDVF
jgi:alkylhydroperoxidase/carboxymuconolactone decarboxylase family protein YurZ